jgi:hypothetical protein
MDLGVNPLSSWTTAKDATYDFGGYLAHAIVPASAIVGMPGSGLGCLNESEVILQQPAGGRIVADVTVMGPN